MDSLIPSERIERRIFSLRERRVMLDSDLAELYGVETKSLNRAVKRNLDRFPGDFMLRLTTREQESLRCQIGTSKPGRGGRRYLAFAFTEQGVAMLSGVLTSPRAVQVNIAIMRAFVRMREVLARHRELAKRLDAAERRLSGQEAVLGEHAQEIRKVFEAIRRLMEPPREKRRVIGFTPTGGD